MIQIILIVFGIVYFVRRSKIMRLTPAQYPGLDTAVFAEWQALELKSIDVFLWGTWGTAVASLVVLLVPPGDSARWTLIALLTAAFWICLIWSAVVGSRAKGMRKRYGFGWDK